MKSIMRFEHGVVWPSITAVILASVVAAAAQQATARVDVADPRPMWAVISEIQARHGRVITYEDPVRMHPSDISDIRNTPAAERRNRPLVIPKGGAFTFLYAPPKDSSDGSIAEMLGSLMKQFNRITPDAQFRVAKTREIFHVLPAKRKDSQGVLQAEVSPLDTIISIPEGSRSGLEQLAAIRAALRASGHPRFGLGTISFGALHNPLDGGVQNEPARSALVRVLESSPYKVSYTLNCTPGVEDDCMLNVQALRARTQ